METKAVAGMLNTHFEKEEEYALPPLGVLSELAQGRLMPAMRSAIVMADKLKATLLTCSGSVRIFVVA